MSLESILEDGKRRMLQRGYSPSRVEEIFAGREIYVLRERVLSRIEEAVEEAVRGAERLGSRAADYIDGLYLDETAYGTVRLAITREAEHLETGHGSFDMKPGLLQNAKVSKDGKLYKVVPIGKKSVGDSTQAANTKLFDLRSMGDNMAMDGSKTLDDIVSSMQRMVNPTSTAKRTTPAEAFRTVTPESTGWEHPGMEGLNQLMDINSRLQGDLEAIVRDFVEAY